MFNNTKYSDYCISELLQSKNKNADYVITLHGLRRSLKHMKNISNALHKDGGFNVLQISYPSTLFPLDKLIEIVTEEILKYIPKDSKSIVHFVGHSLGGLIIRGVIKDNFLNNLGRIIMLGTPNQGNKFADCLSEYKFFQYIYGPVSKQLISNQEAFKHLFGELRSDTGIIAGNKIRYYYFGYLLSSPNDGLVSIEETKLQGMKEHIIIAENHDKLQNNPIVIKQTLHFIKNGTFL